MLIMRALGVQHDIEKSITYRNRAAGPSFFITSANTERIPLGYLPSGATYCGSF